MTTNNPITLTPEEAAKLLGIARSTLSKLRLTGNGPLYCKLGRRVVYRREDLTAWLQSHVARNTSDADLRLPKRLTQGQLTVRLAHGSAPVSMRTISVSRVPRRRRSQQ